MYEVGGQGVAAARAVGAAVSNLAAGAQSIAAGAHSLSAAASAGKLAVDQDTGKSMTEAIDKMLGDVRNMKRDVHRLGEAPKVGSSPDATVMANHSAQVGTGGQSAQDALNGLEHALMELQDGIKKSMDNYGHTDTSSAQNLHQTRH